LFKKLLVFFCVTITLIKHPYYTKQCPEGGSNQASNKPSSEALWLHWLPRKPSFFTSAVNSVDVTPGVWDIAWHLCLASLIFRSTDMKLAVGSLHS